MMVTAAVFSGAVMLFGVGSKLNLDGVFCVAKSPLCNVEQNEYKSGNTQ